MARISPGSSALIARWPGPCAFIMMRGIPASIRFQPPAICRVSRCRSSLACSSTWCEKYTQSSASSFISATGTNAPLIWAVDRLNFSRAMSLIAGCSAQPESETRSRTSTGAPHEGQVGFPSDGLTIRQKGQVYVAVPVPGVDIAIPLLRTVVDVHGLDADPAGPDHLGQVHVVPHHAGLQVLLDRVHRDRGVLVQEATRLDQHLLPRLQRLLEHVAVAVQDQQARLALGDEP